MSTISASTTSTTAFKITTDTTGTLVFQTGASPTTAVTIDASQNVGIGTASPGYTAANRVVAAVNGTTSSILALMSGGTNRAYVYADSTDTTIWSEGTRNLNLGTASAGPINFLTNNTQRMVVDTSGNLGVGVTSPGTKLEIGSSGTVYAKISSSTNTSFRGVQFGINGDSNNYGSLAMEVNGGEVRLTAGFGGWGGYQTFYTNGSERMRIDTLGRVAIGFSSPNAQFVVGGTGSAGWISGSRNTLQLRNTNSSSNQSNFLVFGSAANDAYIFIGNDINANGTTVNQLNIQAGVSGGVYLANGGTSWTAVSDERYKDIIEPITNAAEKVSSLRAVVGKYKTDVQNIRRSFLIAQDVQAVLPEAVTVGENSQGEEQLGLSYTDTIPLLVAAIKELNTRLEAVENK